MNSGGEGVIEFSSTEIEAENDAHFSVSVEAKASDAEHENRKVKRIKTNPRMADSLSEQLGEERSQVSITSLPQELIAMIFSHLDAYFLSTTVTRVCRYFNNVLKSEGFWKGRKTLYINEEESGIDFTNTVIPKCPNIRYLNINFDYTDWQSFEASLTIPNMSFPHLHSVVMINVDRKAENAVEMIVQGAPHLRVIKLEGDLTIKMMEVPAQAKELTAYSVDHMGDYKMKCEPTLTYVFQSCCKLETVDIQIRDVDVDPLLTLLEVRSGTLKSLTWRSELSDLVMEKLSTCPQISHLDINVKGITNESSKFVRKIKQIETLRLRVRVLNRGFEWVSLTNDGFIEVFKDNAFPLLKHLSFVNCGEVNDTVLETVATNSKNLESLELNRTNVTDLGIRSMLGHCSNLRALMIYQYKIKYSCVKDLPKYCPRLHYLKLFYKPVPKPIIREFLNTHPSYNIKKCEELTGLRVFDTRNIGSSNIRWKPIIMYRGNDNVLHIIGHK